MHPHSATAPSKVNFDQRPMLVFWEVTRACQLACKHCRANAMAGALPGELNHEQGLDLIEQVAGFGRPYPILVLTGGDCLLRPDIWDLVAASRARGIPTALSPSVTPQLTPETIANPVKFGKTVDTFAACMTVSEDLDSKTIRSVATQLRVNPETGIHSLQAPIDGFGTSKDGQSIDVVDKVGLAELAKAMQTDTMDQYAAKYGS